MKTTGLFLFCWLVVKFTTGDGHGTGVAVGAGVCPTGVGVGVAPTGVAVGVGVAPTGVGVGVADPPFAVGTVTMSATAVDWSVRFEVPVKKAISGVTSVKWPVRPQWQPVAAKTS